MSDALARLEHFLCKHFTAAIAAVIALALVLRILAAVWVADINPATAKVYEYGEIAASSIAHGALTRDIERPDGTIWTYPTAIMPPLGIAMWLAVDRVFGIGRLSLAIIIGFNILCGCAIVYGCMRIARLLFGMAAVAILAGVIAAIHPVFVYSVATYHAVNFYVVELLALFWVCSSAVSATVWHSILAGVLFGAAILTRTEYLVLGGALLLGALQRHRRAKLAVISLLVALVMLSPWTIRNYLVFHRFIPIANSVGLNLAKGFNREANGSGSWMDKNYVLDRQFDPVLDGIALTPHYESDRDDVFRADALQFMAQNPLRAFVELPIRKILLFCLFDIYDEQTHSIWYQLPLWPVIVFSCLGIAVAWRAGLFRDSDHRSVLALFIAQGLVMACYAVHARYRMNVEPFLFAYAAAGVLSLVYCRGRLPARQAHA